MATEHLCKYTIVHNIYNLVKIDQNIIATFLYLVDSD